MDTGTFDLDGLLKAAREAQALGTRLRSMHHALGEYEGRDAKRVITAVVGRTGTLERLEVADSWRSRLAVADFPAAVADAVAAAQEAFGEAFGEVLSQAADAPPAPTLPASEPSWNPLAIDPYVLFSGGEDVTVERLTRLTRRLDELAEELQSQLDEADQAPGEFLGMGERGMVEIRLDCTGGLLGIDVDQSWLGKCPRWMLLEELASALASARGSVPEKPNFLAAKVDW